MIKKSYFIKTYNIIQYLGSILLLTLIFLTLFKTIQVYTESDSSTLPLVQFQSILFRKLEVSLQWISIVTSILLLVLLLVEIIKRLKNDSLLNLGNSYLGTLRFRCFLKQSQQFPKKITSYTKSTKRKISQSLDLI